VYRESQLGGSVALIMKPGRQGYPWLHSFQVLPPGK
jgi:hypothetical protein